MAVDVEGGGGGGRDFIVPVLIMRPRRGKCVEMHRLEVIRLQMVDGMAGLGPMCTTEMYLPRSFFSPPRDQRATICFPAGKTGISKRKEILSPDVSLIAGTLSPVRAGSES